MLIIDCCVRGNESSTRKLCEAYLETLPQNTEKLIVEPYKMSLKPFNAEMLKLRNELCHEKNFSHEMFTLARQFKDADEIIVAAPFWDLSFPSALKVYFEHVSVSGLTFGYEGHKCVGRCKAEKLHFFSTCGGFYGERHLGYEYVKAMANMLGIKECVPCIIEGMDMNSMRQTLLNRKIEEIKSNA